MSSNKDTLIKSIEIENEGNKYKCNFQIIKEIIYISIYINNNVYEGNISLNKIKNQIETFNDYNVNEIFEEIKILNKNNYKLIKEDNNKYKLKIKFIILRRKKYLYINLYNNNKDIDKNELIKYISKLKEIIKIKEKKIKELEYKINKQNKNNINNNNIYNNFDIKLKEPIHKLNYHKDSVTCFTILKDGRLVSGSGDKSIIIYNKKTYQPNIIIKEYDYGICCITTLSSGALASCSLDNTIKIFNIKDNRYDILQTLNYHSDWVLKIIELKNKSLVSCSRDNSIIFYNKDNNKYIKNCKLNTKGHCYSIIETKDNEICYSESSNTIYFYDLLQQKEKSKINDINTNGTNLEGFIMISKELLLIPGKNQISIININKYNLLKVIDVPNSNRIFGACMLNENMLLTGDESKAIRQWKIEGDNLILISIKENAHNGIILSLINRGDGYIISGSSDKSIKIW